MKRNLELDFAMNQGQAPAQRQSTSPFLMVMDEESQSSIVSSSSRTSTSTTVKPKRLFTKAALDHRSPVTTSTLFEYQWPPHDPNAEFYFLQEQISEYLGVKSFRRKYPHIKRRVVDMEERDFLRSTKVVTETQCDLGLTALQSCDVLDIMFQEYPEKYEEYRRMKREQELKKLKYPNQGQEEAIKTCDRSGILKSCASWNMRKNKERMVEHSFSFDLQSGILHCPEGKAKVLPKESTKMGYYPVQVLPRQYTDHYKEYTSEDLSRMPLKTVMKDDWDADVEMKSDFGSSSSSDSEDSTESGLSSSSSSDEDNDNETEKTVAKAVDVDPDIIIVDGAGNLLYRGRQGKTKVSGSPDGKCKTCKGGIDRNKDGKAEVLLHCSRCDVANHPTCLDLTLDMLPFITKYRWKCTDCKNCVECKDRSNEDKMVFCDCCDRGYHIYCIGLRKVPTGQDRWHCSVCSVCNSCGATKPSPDDRMAEWYHQFQRRDNSTWFYLHSLCVDCHNKKGRVFSNLPREV